eukprot:1432609-Rhodomonas_salina.4
MEPDLRRVQAPRLLDLGDRPTLVPARVSRVRTLLVAAHYRHLAVDHLATAHATASVSIAI